MQADCCPAADNRINSLEDLRGKKVGTLYNTVAKRMLEEMGEVAVNIYSGQVEPFRDLSLNRIDAVFVDLPIASYYAMPNPQLRLVGKPAGEGLPNSCAKRRYCPGRGVEQNHRETLRTGELKKIYGRWGLWNTAQENLSCMKSFYKRR